jgi:rSAM/selenodomain-associated transferase 1
MRPASREEVAVAVLGRSPWPGKVKTRLIPALGPQGAADLQTRLIIGAVDAASKAQLGPVTVWLTDDDHPIVRTLSEVKVQPNGDLGTRMLAAFEAAAGPTLVIGTDCPAMAPRHLQDAADALIAGHDAVFIPAEDGGYVLIGLRAPVPELLSDMPWGTDRVMGETRARLSRLGLTWHELAALWDVDRPEDLARLRALID